MSKILSAQHILVDQKFEADDILRKIDQGVSFEELAKDYSSCSSSQDGGHLGEFRRGMMVRSFEEELIKLSINEISAPVKTQFGYHIIRRLK